MNNPLDEIVGFLKHVDELGTAKTLLTTMKKYASGIAQYDQLGRLFHDIKDYDQAIQTTEKSLVLATHPAQMYSARSNLAKLHNHNNDPITALSYINANLSINPEDQDAQLEKVFALYLMGKAKESNELLMEVYNHPDTPEAIKNRCRFNMGSYQMDQGNFYEGIRNFIGVGHEIGIWKKIPLENPWSGEVIPGAAIAIIAEGGIGDELINVRFMRHIEKLGMTPIWITNHDGLVPLFNRNGFTTVRSKKEVPPDAHYCLSFFLPIHLELQESDLDIGSYLKPSEDYLIKWSNILPKGNKIALRWSGNPAYEQDLSRSLSLDLYMASMWDKKATFVSVQKDHDLESLSGFPDVFNAAPYLDTLEDLLACLALCDTLVTSCTSVAHMGAASGVRTFVFPPIACYYVWMNGGNRWYGTHVSVNRQTNRKDWNFVPEVLRNV